ncbi:MULTISPECIES: MBL fold metallo-hydrolase [unclassified Bacillus (in: firmicutes)]|uniref:MBL fold metallo-hydrolase n=1 Tax=unclassified Bacillus (in: firmicutes) TaxID=185979 RepID=UPI0015878DB4|nr:MULTISPECIES: MBL fold metallo-hydrolase [unclassified Bacillus (in: firmicutes)]
MSKFEKLSERIWFMHAEHESDRPILAYIKGEKRSLLIDAGTSSTHAKMFQSHLNQLGLEMPDYLVFTHCHWDHTFASSSWKSMFIAHDKTSQAISKMMECNLADPSIKDLIRIGFANEDTIEHMSKEYGEKRVIQLVQPNLTFSEKISIDLGGLTCEVTHVGGDHAEDSCLIYIKEEKTLFIGDALGPAIYDGPRYYRAEGFLDLVDKVFAYDAETFIESHDRPLNKQEYKDDLADWILLAQLVRTYGEHQQKVLKEFRRHLKMEELTTYWQKAVDWFLEGEKRNEK